MASKFSFIYQYNNIVQAFYIKENPHHLRRTATSKSSINLENNTMLKILPHARAAQALAPREGAVDRK
jgi:hypothetical protein